MTTRVEMFRWPPRSRMYPLSQLDAIPALRIKFVSTSELFQHHLEREGYGFRLADAHTGATTHTTSGWFDDSVHSDDEADHADLSVAGFLRTVLLCPAILHHAPCGCYIPFVGERLGLCFSQRRGNH